MAMYQDADLDSDRRVRAKALYQDAGLDSDRRVRARAMFQDAGLDSDRRVRARAMFQDAGLDSAYSGGGGAATPQKPTVSRDQLTAILRQYGHSPIDLTGWETDINSGKTTLQNFQSEVQRTMSQPGVVRYNWDAPQTAQQAPQTAPQQQATREMIRDAWMARGAGQTTQDLQNFISQYSYYNPQIVNSGAGGEKVRWDFGNGNVQDLDMIIDVGGKGLAGWGGYAGGLGYNGGNVPAAAPAGNAALTPGGPGPTAYTSNPAAQSALMQALMARLTQNKVPGKDDPTIREASDRFAAQQERARRLSESEAAERLSAKRLGSSGVMDVERRMASERAGEASGAFESQLVLREIDARRQEIQQAIQSLQGIISQDQMMALQRELANLNAALDRERLASSTGLGYAQLAQQASQFGDTMGLNWANFNRQGDPEYLAYISSLR